MSKIIGKNITGLKKSYTRLNVQQKGLLLVAIVTGVAVSGFLFMSDAGTYSTADNPTPGLPYATWPVGSWLDVEYKHYWRDGINVKKYFIPIVVTWEADNGIAFVKVEAGRVEWGWGYSTLESKVVTSEWGGATLVTEAYNMGLGLPYDMETPDIRVRLTITDLKGNKFTSPALKTSSTRFCDNNNKDPDAKDPAAYVNYQIFSVYKEDPEGATEVPPETPTTPYTPPADYVPPEDVLGGGVGIEDLFLISGLAVTAVVINKKRKRKLEA